MEKRNPFIAGLLSIITPGLGSLYVSKIKFFYYIYASFIILSLLVTLDNLYVSYISAFLALLLWFCSIIISFVQAKKIKEVDKKDLKKKYFYIIFIIALISVNIFTSGNSKFRAFSIPASSMEPTLHPGDKIITSKNYYVNNEINYGDLVVFKTPDGVNWIKRVIATPGDQFTYVNDELFINGNKVQYKNIGKYVGVESGIEMTGFVEKLETNGVEHQILIDPKQSSRSVKGVVPEGHYFVMGDNRNRSSDSRFWGFVPEDYIIGKAFAIWMHYDDSFKFDRLGLFN